jgi:peptidoglycan hydrolase-like protein with peptidoglycan-binding domain
MMLKNGSKHENVKCVQEILQELGYHPGAADGDFGDKTEAAVIQFQERHNLYADGVVGPSTWAISTTSSRHRSPPKSQAASTELSVTPSGSMNCM